MAEPPIGPCDPWCTAADMCSPCDDYSFPAGLLDDAIEAASGVLFMLSARQFPGVCAETVRPCARSRSKGLMPDRGYGGYWSSSLGSCSCNREDRCGCSSRAMIELPSQPVIDITEVKVDGVVLGAAFYRVDEWKWLVRLPDADGTNPGWPCCQRLDLADTEDETWSVTYTFGRTPPQAGLEAAKELACQLALACQPETVGECNLPQRVQSITRQGVSYVLLDPMAFLDKGKTGLYRVDLFLAAYNPRGIAATGGVYSPDIGPSAIRADT